MVQILMTKKTIAPGIRANKEFGIVSPFYQLKFTKDKIRSLAKCLDLVFSKAQDYLPCFADSSKREDYLR